jgi:thymidylate kinase
MSLYILEGPRGTGKTTLAQRLSEAYAGRAAVIKFAKTNAPPLFMMEFLARNYLALIDSRTICILDRFHLTEFVMRSLDGKVPMATLMTTTKMIDIMLKNCGAITYVLKSPPFIRKNRILHDPNRDEKNRMHEWRDYNEIDRQWDLAASYFNKSTVRVVPNVTSSDLDKVAFSIMREHKGDTKLLEAMIPFEAPMVTEESVLDLIAEAQ